MADRLRAMILEGDYMPGSHLQEVPVAEAMGVSRTPVRAALAALEREGLLDYVPKRGFAVRVFSREEIADKYFVRSVLEGAAAGQCARCGISEADLATLDAALADGDRILAGGRLDPDDLPAYRQMNNQFHRTITTASGSAGTADLVRQIGQIPFLSDRIILWHDYKLIDRSHDDHHRVRDAIATRDPARAEALMREHVSFMGQVVRRYLSSAAAPEPLRFAAEDASDDTAAAGEAPATSDGAAGEGNT
ncbi:GntR family transcriptional regulator [Acuticoccus sp. I52.16.1]|uniref:GntR family transcriptional regulator n=1 Tax=Acuticoccus sp. I52.16.1 TaxID=2928472 RepID=UPI001FD124E4|nr:GntR family transcriptional regulator [Acuticoccus sp. I52.16.1]UOM32562.1 GntR family transcriptional regulator [Acuticoccus sp. I52.16.1]